MLQHSNTDGYTPQGCARQVAGAHDTQQQRPTPAISSARDGASEGAQWRNERPVSDTHTHTHTHTHTELSLARTHGSATHAAAAAKHTLLPASLPWSVARLGLAGHARGLAHKAPLE
jgi:hypothetical protein